MLVDQLIEQQKNEINEILNRGLSLDQTLDLLVENNKIYVDKLCGKLVNKEISLEEYSFGSIEPIKYIVKHPLFKKLGLDNDWS